MKLTPYHLYQHHVTIDIIVPIFNALADVKQCLNSVVEQREGFSLKLILVNDASDDETTSYLRQFVQRHDWVQLLENSTNLGYTRSVNVAMRQARSDVSIILNSDTLVTKGWLSGLVRCLFSDDKLGIVGPLSNAASWQNVPMLYDEHNKFAINRLPKAWSANDMAACLASLAQHDYPRVSFVNGFCFAIKKAVVQQIGLFDEQAFPLGYGEENDYCLRAIKAGFGLAIAHDVYVYHAKSKSFGHTQREALSKLGSAKVTEKHGKAYMHEQIKRMKEHPQLAHIRKRVQEVLNQVNLAKSTSLFDMAIAYLLPLPGSPSGGIHSVVQEAASLMGLGFRVAVCVPEQHRQHYLSLYATIDKAEQLFVGFSPQRLEEIACNFNVFIATIFSSVSLAQRLAAVQPSALIAYYIQDYEPLFFELGSAQWQKAVDSYTLIPHTLLFAKTDWIAQKVYQEHGVRVQRVRASIDHGVYYPSKHKPVDERIFISAMIRPSTPRRGAERTLRMLTKLHDVFGDHIVITLFGCTEAELGQLTGQFPHQFHGVLNREQVAQLLRASDWFLDLSDYQAFGRTALEAMACGAVPILTSAGGTNEFARQGENAWLVDVTDASALCEWLMTIVQHKPKSVMRQRALDTASAYQLQSSVLSVLSVLKQGFSQSRLIEKH